MTRSLRPLVPVLLLVLVLPAVPAHADGGMESEFVALVNRERAAAGLPSLSVASDLTSVARNWSGAMASESRLYHNPNLGSQVSGWRKLGENVGRGPSVSSLHAAFMASDGHRRNILDPDWNQIGVGVVVDGSTVWVTKVFRRSRDAAPPSSSSSSAGSTSSASSSTAGTASRSSPSADERAAAERRRAEEQARREQLRQDQQRLAELGWYDAAVDGVAGPATRAAVERFQEAAGLGVDGVIGARTREALHAEDAISRADHEWRLVPPEERSRARAIEAAKLGPYGDLDAETIRERLAAGRRAWLERLALARSDERLVPRPVSYEGGTTPAAPTPAAPAQAVAAEEPVLHDPGGDGWLTRTWQQVSGWVAGLIGRS